MDREFGKYFRKNQSKHYDLYIQSDTLSLADIFESFWSKSIKIYNCDPVHCFTLPQFSFQAALKMQKYN